MAKILKKHTVLLVEDDADIRNFIARLLELEGYRVIQAADGIAGLIALNESPVDLVLLDLRLPELDGWSILTTMKQDETLAKIPVVIVSALAEEATRREALDRGASLFLVKPLSANRLRTAINSILQPKPESYALPKRYAIGNAYNT